MLLSPELNPPKAGAHRLTPTSVGDDRRCRHLLHRCKTRTEHGIRLDSPGSNCSPAALLESASDLRRCVPFWSFGACRTINCHMSR